MANILSRQYASVFSVPSGKNRTREVDNNIPILDDTDFTEKDIINAIDELRNNSASGSEGLAAILLKKCKEGNHLRNLSTVFGETISIAVSHPPN